MTERFHRLRDDARPALALHGGEPVTSDLGEVLGDLELLATPSLTDDLRRQLPVILLSISVGMLGSQVIGSGLSQIYGMLCGSRRATALLGPRVTPVTRSLIGCAPVPGGDRATRKEH